MFLDIILKVWGILGGYVFQMGYTSNNNSFPPVLTQQEEQEYFEKFAEGDIDAKNILIERNLRLVAHVVKKFKNIQIENDDLISIGTIGLIKGITTYNSEKGVKFATYASRCIENAILFCVTQIGIILFFFIKRLTVCAF